MNHVNNIIQQFQQMSTMMDGNLGGMIRLHSSTESLILSDDSPYQAELIFNKFLPYSNELAKEADTFLATIKANLGRCSIMRNINPGCVFWTQMLSKYVTLYGLRFTKDEHISLIKLLYDLIIIPELQPSLVETFAKTLTSLLRKKETLSPEELEVPWKPLYELCKTTSDRLRGTYAANGNSFYRYSMLFESTLERLVVDLKVYFPASATQEILNELRPYLYPLDLRVMNNAMKLLQWFLPVQVSVKHHSISHQLWFQEFMGLWDTCHNTAYWENDLLRLMSKLATHNIGYIDWNPYIPIMFSRFVRTLNLPVHYNKTPSNSYHNLTTSSIAEWIAAVLGDQSNAQMYLEKFLKTIETYFHPANYGRWLGQLGHLFVKIIYYVTERVYRERCHRKTWETPIPEEFKLTEANIDDFVNSMMPVAMTGVFNKLCSMDFIFALQHLSMMRPNLVIPAVLEKLYPTLGTDIEPHKLITAMTCMSSIARPLVQGSRFNNKDYAYADGPLNVLPLLFSSLPGIDPNDPQKCFESLRLISVYVALIPIVDSSGSRAKISDEERQVCTETARFEDFILQFMNKLFILIDSSSLESVRLENMSNTEGKSRLEMLAERNLAEVFTSLLLQTSDSIFMSALNKMRTFIMENTLETKISGRMVAIMCMVFSHVNSHATLKALMPYLTEKILEMIVDDEVVNEETLDNQLLFFLLLLEKVVTTQGDALLPYVDTLVKIMDKVTRFKCLEGNQLGTQLLKNVLHSLCSVQLVRIDRNLDDPEYPYWQEWGDSVNFDSVQLKWYVPGEQELTVTQNIFMRYFMPAVTAIQNYIETKNSLSRDELQKTLRIIYNILEGCCEVLPISAESPIIDKQFESCVMAFRPFLGTDFELKMPDGSNVRKFLVKTLTALQEIMLQNVEDDTRSLLLLTQIWLNLSNNKTRLTVMISGKLRSFYMAKKTIKDKLSGDKGYIPEFLAERVCIQQQLRKANVIQIFTPTIRDILLNLFKLSISQYSRVRMSAQTSLFGVLNDYPNAFLTVIPQLVEILGKDTEIHHDAYKGALYLISTSQANTPLANGDWQVYLNILPALVLSKPSEKPSVIKKQDQIIFDVAPRFPLVNVYLNVPENCISSAMKLWSTGIQPSLPQPNQEEIQQGIRNLKELGDINFQAYNMTCDKLLRSILENNLHWRHRQMALKFISVIMHPDHILPPHFLRYFLNSIINDSIDERKLGWTLTTLMLQQLKKKHPKITINVPNRESSLKPGRRADNEWLQYKLDKRPSTAEQWDEPRFVNQMHVGYYAWPERVEVYAPSSQQPSVDRTRELSEHEREVEQFFGNEQNIGRLIKFISLEGKKGKDHFLCDHVQLFKYLFRNHGDALLAMFLPHLKQMVQDKQESVQRAAAEIVAGIVSGTKHWPFSMIRGFWEAMLPVLRLALGNITEETLNDWNSCFSIMTYKRDPSRMHWLIECLVDECRQAKSETSFIESARFRLLSRVLTVFGWRISELLNRLLPLVETRLLENPFDSVRDQLALTTIVICNVNLRFRKPELDPHNDYPMIENFIQKLYPRVQILLTEKNNKSPAYVEATKLMNTICTVISNGLVSSNIGAISSFYEILPIAIQMENNDNEEELSKACTRALAELASSSTLSEHLPAALQVIDDISRSSSWSARISCVQFLQVLLFHNMSTLLSNDAWISTIRGIVLRLLQDETVEVREKSAQVINGMLHCTLVTDEQALLEEFRKMAKTKLRSKKGESTKLDLNNAIRLRHAGVLGLCAFIQAHPYDVPKDIPPIFEYLSLNLNDPEPIPTTIRKTFSDFKRTHCDGWTGLQGLTEVLSEEQFALLQDLTVPPSYYA